MPDFVKKIYRKCRKVSRELRARVAYAAAHEIVEIPYEEALAHLQALAPRPVSTALTRNHIGEILYDLTIIVPAYNAEKWIRECVDSILSQETDYSFLAVFVDDGSRDQTGAILDGYLPNKRMRVVHQENRGYSGARNAALKELHSEYIMFVDSDDRLLPGAVQTLLQKAKETDADIVEGNGYRFDETGRLGKVKADDSDHWGAPWLKVIRSKLFARLEFPEGYLYEDTIINGLVYPLAEKTVTVSDEIYAYRIHPGSITQRHDDNLRRVDSFWILLLLEELRKELGLDDREEWDRLVLNQIWFTQRRCVRLPEDVQKLLFACEAGYVKKEDLSSIPSRFKRLYESLRQSDYGKFSVICSFL